MAELTVFPDATSLKTRFPEFAGTEDAAIAFAVEQALREVDDTWAPKDRMLAITMLAAHYLAVASYSAGVDGRDVMSESIGPISVTYANLAAVRTSIVTSPFQATSYGKQFLALLSRNFRGPVVIA